MADEFIKFQRYDKRFETLINPTCKVELLYDGCRWAEGPVWFPSGNYLLWSDIPNNRILRWVPGGMDSGISVFRDFSNYTNGNTRDNEGRLISCQHGSRSVTRTEIDGSITVLVDNFEGKRLNSPNDVVVKSDGTIWFTDPPYGILTDYEGHKSEMEQSGCYVFMFDPNSGKTRIVVDDFDRPNGLAFSPDERVLYVADSACGQDPDKPRHIRSFRVMDNSNVVDRDLPLVLKDGCPDGLRVDAAGNIWTSSGSGIDVFSEAGDLLGRIDLPQWVANLTFGGYKKNRIFVTCTNALYSFFVNSTGAR